VSQNLKAASGTALDVLKDHPSIQTDQDGNISLRGSSNFSVLINGRPSVMQGSDALRQIPANIVDNIEIITNPSAKYDAEGAAGIINIVTKKQFDSTLSGVFNAGAGSRDKYNSDITINYRNSDYTLTGGVDYRKANNPVDQTLNRSTYMPTGTMYNNTWVEGSTIRNNYMVRGGIDYNINPQSGFSFNLSFGNISFDRGYNLKVQNLSSLGNIYSYTNDSYTLSANYLNSSIYYNYKFKPNVDELVFEATYTNISLPSTQNTKEFTADNIFNTLTNQPKIRELRDETKRNDARIKLNYSYNFNPKSKLELGLQTNLYLRKFDVTNQNYDWTKSVWIVTTDFTNKFDYKNNIYAAFVTYSNTLFDLDYQLGLRSEYTDRLLAQTTLGGDYKFSELDLFPSLNISGKISTDQQIQFNYSRRINRPNEQLLNPYPNYSDAYLRSAGNPGLLPEFTHSLELNYQKFITGVFLSAQTYLRISNNSLSQTMKVDDQGRLILTFDNLSKTTTGGIELTASITAIPWLRLDPALNFYHYSLSGEVLNKQTESSTFSWTSRLISTISLSSDTRIQLMLNYIGKQITAQAAIDPFFICGATVRQDLFDKKLTLTLQGQNLFNTLKINIDSKGDNFRTLASVKPESSIITLTLSYNFNNYKRAARGPEKVDLNVNEGL
jgi:outer membrane receptor protein involved in Fe transport